MDLNEAIRLLTPYHTPKLVCVSLYDNLVSGQLSTGSLETPFIDVVDSMVSAEDIYDVISQHTDNLVLAS